MMYDAYQGDGRRRRSRASPGPERPRDPRRLVGPSDRIAMGADERLLRTGRARRLHPRAARLCASTASRSTARPFRSKSAGVLWTPFCQLLRFRKAGGEDDPKILLVAPMSGHFATLLRGTIRTLLRDHQVFITDWINPRNVKLEDGRFSLEDYTQHLIDFVRFIGEDCHIVAVCQPTVSALAATAVMARERDGHPAGEPHADGRADRRAHLADQGQRARPGKADRMVPRQHDRNRAGQVRGARPARLSGISSALRLHEHERRAALEILRRPLPPSRRRRHREGGCDPRLLQGIFRDHGHERGLLSRNRRSGVPALSAAARDRWSTRASRSTCARSRRHSF